MPHKSDADDFPISEENILRADDPRPQRVPQYPSKSTGARRPLKKAEEMIPTSVYDTEKADQEMQAQYGMGEAPQKPAFLYVERGPGAGQLLEVKQGTIVIGRASVSDLRLQHPSISRRHAQVRRIGDQFFVKDLGSQNGSFVNKTRIANEVEVKIGDTLALGNALLRLRGPMQRGEKPATPSSQQNGKARVPTAVVARPQYSTGQQRAAGSNRMVKIAVFAGAVGFGLAAVLAFALIKMATGGTTSSASKEKPSKTVSVASAPNDAINEALKKKQAESKPVVVAVVKPPEPVADEPVAEEPTIDDSPAVVKSVPGVAPSVAPAKAQPTRVAAAKRVTSSPRASAGDDEEAPAAKGGSKRTQILAPYERGNAEGSLELAKSAGEKELSDKLLKFISAYDAGQEALISNNGTVAIKEFTKALALDEQLSSGWGKYGSEIRKHLGNLYFLVGKQYEANGDDAKAKAAYQAALKNDPGNGKAKGAMAKISGGGGEDEDEAPAPKPAPKKAPSKTSIDDAFGD